MLALAIEFIRDSPEERSRSWTQTSAAADASVGIAERRDSTREQGGGTTCFGGHSGGVTPGPIPNPEVKPSSADGTALETGWESRSPPRLLDESRLRAAFVVSGPLRFGWHASSLRTTTREA